MAPPKGKGGVRAKNMDKLIAAVQARECLWDKSYRGHRNRFKLERYWNEVAAEVGTTSINCRKKWKNLKDQCRKEMKKNPADSDWPHFQKLSFIHNQFLTEDDENDGVDTNDEVFSALDESIKTPKLGYTMRKKLLMNKRRNIDVDLNKLVELVRAREIIWNRQLKGHHNWYKLDEAWKEIAVELGVTRDEARLKWKYLRDQARKEVRKQDSEWDFLPKLQFLTNQFNDYENTEMRDDDDQFSQDYDADHEQSMNYFMEPQTQDEPDLEEPVQANVPVKEDEFDEFDTKPVILETDFYDDEDDALKSVVPIVQIDHGCPRQVEREANTALPYFTGTISPHFRLLFENLWIRPERMNFVIQ
ncbi:alcohol dehydrogenase transcription factor myb/SANT-like domain-containing protein [Phthorimaea operculella]|nr:alcohol dehydrogenase transcription factor myb/SANT-like domain-containing protein [Phthorimaea operculella]